MSKAIKDIGAIQKVSKIATELADREAIRDCIYRYCRGIDRMDAELLLSVYWPEVNEVHGVFTAWSAQEFVDNVIPRLKEMKSTSLRTSNIMIDIQGDIAYVESYIQGVRRVPKPDGTLYDQVESGRYLDRMERRNDEWRIIKRIVVRDWYREVPVETTGWGETFFYENQNHKAFEFGQRKPNDPSYAIEKLRP